MVFKLTDADWEQAEKYLAGKADGSKFDKHQRDPKTGSTIPGSAAREHSFVLIEGVIYALSNRNTFLPGIGSTGVVKKGLSRAGHLVAIKIEFGDLKDLNSPQCQIAKQHKLLLAQAVRSAPNMKITIRAPLEPLRILKGNQKRYTVMEWLGDALFDVITEKWEMIPQVTKDLIALRACLCVQAFNQSTTHNDIKAENLTVIFEDEDVTKIQDVTVNAIDTDYSLALPKGQTFVIGDDARGSPAFIAPEILSKRYSPLSDSYALAVMLLFQLNVAQIDIYAHVGSYLADSLAALRRKPQSIINPIEWLEQRKVQIEPELREIFVAMFNPDVKQRADANAIIKYLCQQLKAAPGLSSVLKAEIEEIELTTRLKMLTANFAEMSGLMKTQTVAEAVEGLLLLTPPVVPFNALMAQVSLQQDAVLIPAKSASPVPGK